MSGISELLSDLRMYSRFAWGLHGFLRGRITLPQAEEIVRRRLEEREANFLRLVERGVYGHPRSPYLPLLKLAGCEPGDLRQMLRDRGLESTLRALREAGVYVSFEEFKGREPMVRQGRVLPTRARDFDTPHLSASYQVESGGSTGAGSRVELDLEHLAATASTRMLCYAAHGLLDTPTAVWGGIPPDSRALAIILRRARFDRVPQRWFTPLSTRELHPALKHRFATQFTIGMSRLMGVPIPSPRPLPLDQAHVLARWAAATIRARGSCLIRSQVSTTLRICLAARELGLDLRGAAFMGGGEPPTPAKVREITRGGARWIPSYAQVEAGTIGSGCARPLDGNDVHFLEDGLALIQHPRQVPGTEIDVTAFHFTTLLPSVPKVMINVETDDYGVLEQRACGCPFERYGFRQHIREIRSFRKLTGEGVTLIGSDMVRILEEVLPGRFGGSPLDYQLQEEEDERGFTRLSLIVSPRVPLADEAALIEVVLAELGRLGGAADSARATWRQSGSLRVKRQEPAWTARGKLMPLHLIRSERFAATASDAPRAQG